MKSTLPSSMIILELSEAEQYFLDIFIEQGYLPNFKHLIQQGTRVTTFSDKLINLGSSETAINPWKLWPSIYTGLSSIQHGITGHGQEGFQFSEETIWSALNTKGYTTGLFGIPLQESIPHTAFAASKIQYYLPELALTPHKAIQDLRFPNQTIQDLLLFTSHIYDKNYFSYHFQLLWKLLRASCNGLPSHIALDIIKQIPGDMLSPKKYYQHRLWYAQLQMSIFDYLFNRYTPQFSICHLNFISDIQLRFWRAFEPENFSETLGEVDKCFYRTAEERRIYEQQFKSAILESFRLVDKWLKKWLIYVDSYPEAVLVVMNGLGQHRHDPAFDPNPTLIFHNIDKLMRFAEISEYHLVEEKRSDLTLNFKNESEAELAAYKFSEIKLLAKKPFFTVEINRHQLFLEANLTPEIWIVGSGAWLENEATGNIAELFDFVYFSPSIDQEMSKRSDKGWLSLYGNLSRFKSIPEELNIIQIKAFLLQYFSL